MNKIWIATAGKASSGKDEFADIAKEYGFKVIPFAQAVKDEVSKFLDSWDIPYKIENLWGSQKDKEEKFQFHHTIDIIDNLLEPYISFTNNGTKEVSFRSLLQAWGTEYRRSQNPNYWIDQVIKQLNQNTVTSDCRFLNEAKAIKDKNGYIVKINRSNLFNISNPNHASEKELELIEADITINNNGTLEEYHQKCRNCIELILGNKND